MSRFNCTVSEVTVMNLQPDKKPIPITPVGEMWKGLRSPSFHHSAPNLSETLPIQEETKAHAEITSKEGVASSKPFYAATAQSMNNLALTRLVKLAPLEIPLEVKEAQLKKMMSIQRDVQLAALKSTIDGSIGSQPHMRRVKNVPQIERENFPKAKTIDKSTLENQGSIHSSSVDKPLCEIQIILPTEENAKPAIKLTCDDFPVPCYKPLIPQKNLQTLDLQEDVTISDKPQGNGRRFTLKQMKEQQEFLSKNKPLKAIGVDLEESKMKTTGLRAHKTLSDASKLIDTIAKKHRGAKGECDDLEDDLVVRKQSSRRLAMADIIQVEEE